MLPKCCLRGVRCLGATLRPKPSSGQWIAKLHEAEGRRAMATPSTLPFHVAARDTQYIAAEIWEAARSSDEDTPETEANRRTTPRPVRPGLI